MNGKPMGNDGQLAVLLRTAQWAIDDLAHDLGASRVTPERLVEMADALEKVSVILRQRASEPVQLASGQEHPVHKEVLAEPEPEAGSDEPG